MFISEWPQNDRPFCWGRFHSRRSDSFCRSNSFLPEISSDCETCFRVGHFGGQRHFSRKKCDVILELKFIFTNKKWLRNDQQNGRSFCGHSEMNITPKINLTEGSIWPTTVKRPSEVHVLSKRLHETRAGGRGIQEMGFTQSLIEKFAQLSYPEYSARR